MHGEKKELVPDPKETFPVYRSKMQIVGFSVRHELVIKIKNQEKIMTNLGWTMLIVSWGAIISLSIFCFYKIMKVKKDNIHAPLDIDTGDVEEE